MQANMFPYWLSQFELEIVLLALRNILPDTSVNNLSLPNDNNSGNHRGQRKANE